MKKLIFIILMFLTLSLNAQDVVIKFMGIPVNGRKSAMVSQLKKKGFKYDRYNDCLTGRFNGQSVKLFIVENNKKVYRICVMDAYYSNATDIIIRYNNLIDQFENNDMYIALDDNEKIDSKEDLHYEMFYNNKRYEAVFSQVYKNDTNHIEMKLLSYDDVMLVNKSYIDTIHNQCIRLAKDMGDEYYKEQYLDSIVGMSEKEVFEYDQRFVNRIQYALRLVVAVKKQVWFMIQENDDNYRQYKILMYYDNGFNAPNGEDL